MATAAERMAKSRALKKQREGKPLTERDRAVIAPGLGIAASRAANDPAPAPAVETPTAAPAAQQAAAARPASWVAVEPAQRPAAIPLGPSTKPHAPTTGGTCKIKDCPACAGRNRPGPQICATTGEEVYPPLSMSAARGMASVLFAIIGFAIKLFRGAEEIHMPTELQRDQLAKGIIEIARRRAGWISLYDDLMTAGWALGSYCKSAASAPIKAPEKRKEVPPNGTETHPEG